MFPENTWFGPGSESEAMAIFGMLVVLALILHYATRRYVVIIIRNIIAHTEWNEMMISHRLFQRFAWIIPLIIIHQGLIFIHGINTELYDLIRRIVTSLMILVAMLCAGAATSAFTDMYQKRPQGVSRPIKSYMQILKVFIYFIGIVLIVANLINQSPWYFLSGIGAMTAVLVLIFKETILSLVAGVQLTNNDLLRVGDWIEMPQFNADGTVAEIALNTVRVRNWDNTETIIPTHMFLAHSFKNWRSMEILGGRRIQRTVNIDVSSIKFIDAAEIAAFAKNPLLADFIESKKKDAPAERLTNTAILRAYVYSYLRNHPKIHQKMTMLVSQRDPGPMGLPLEIYCFANETKWANYEAIQSEIMEHVIATAPDFGVKIFQRPSGGNN